MFTTIDKTAKNNPFLAGVVAAQEAMVHEIWPENWPAFELFGKLIGQWRMGMNGPVALDHNVLFQRLDRMNLPPDEYESMDAAILAMEAAALEAMRDKD